MPSKSNRTCHISTHGDIRHNLKISNLPSHYNDIALISDLKRLLHPISNQTHFKKIIFKRTRGGKPFLFVKFAEVHHIIAAYSTIHNKSMGGQTLSVQFADDDDLPQTSRTSSGTRAATLYHRSGFMVQHLQTGSERMTTVVPHHMHGLAPNKAQNTDIRHQREEQGKEEDVIMEDKPNIDSGEDAPRHPMQTQGDATQRDARMDGAKRNGDNHRNKDGDIAQRLLGAKRDKSGSINGDTKRKITQTISDCTSRGTSKRAAMDIDVDGGANIGDKGTLDAAPSALKRPKHCHDGGTRPTRAHRGDKGAKAGVDMMRSSALDCGTNGSRTVSKQSQDMMCNVYSKKGKKKSRPAFSGCSTKVHNVAFNRKQTNGETLDAVRRKTKVKLPCRLFIANINQHIGDNQLKLKFEKFGSVASANVVRVAATNASKGVGFVTFKSSKASKRALQAMHNALWYGQKLCVSFVSDTDGVKTQEIIASKLVPERRIIPTDPRRIRKPIKPPPPMETTLKPVKPPQVFISHTRSAVIAPVKPPPPPVIKPPIMHKFSSKRRMETVYKDPKPPAPPPPHEATTRIKLVPSSVSDAHIQMQTIQSGNSKAILDATVHVQKHNSKAKVDEVPRVVSAVIPRIRIMPVPAIQPPPIVPAIQVIRPQSIVPTLTAPASPIATNTIWNDGVLLGNLPVYPTNAYHKLRFQIEQSCGTPITSLHMLEKQIVSSSNPSDSFTCCCIFDSQDEMKRAFARLKGCMIIDQRITCDISSKYIAQLQAMFAPTSSPTSTHPINDVTDSDPQVQSMSNSHDSQHRSFSPPSASHSPERCDGFRDNARGPRQYRGHYRKRLAMRRRDRSRTGRSRDRAVRPYATKAKRNTYYKVSRKEDYRGLPRRLSPDRSGYSSRKYDRVPRRERRRFTSRSRSRSAGRDRGQKAVDMDEMDRINSRCVVMSCCAKGNVQELSESQVTHVMSCSVKSTIARMYKRTKPVHAAKHNVIGCELYWYIRFPNLYYAIKCLEKMKKGYKYRGYLLTVESVDERMWNESFGA
eukprot:561420_1